jgi:regulator of sigma E protease
LISDQFTRENSATAVKDYVAVGFTSEDSPAEQAGFETGDKLLSLADTPINSTDDLFDATEANEGSQVTIVYEREGEQYSQLVDLRIRTDEQSPLGIGPAAIEVNKYSLLEAPVVGAGTTIQVAGETDKGLGSLVADIFGGEFSEAAENVSGPVGIFVILNNASIFGFEYLLFFIGIISLTLAVMNALPIPALDGGKLAVSGIFKLLKKPLTKEVESAIHGSGFIILMIFIVLISVIDVQRFF